MENVIPIGFRFRPTDEELVEYYLKCKVYNQPLPSNNICTLNVYKFNPKDLIATMGGNGDKERYFFTPTKRITKGGSRSGRTTPEGYWKTTMGDQPIRHNGKLLGYKKTLVYYHRTSRTQAEKTTWIMHEYRLVEGVADDLVVCKIHDHKKGGGTKGRDHRIFTSQETESYDPASYDDQTSYCGHLVNISMKEHVQPIDHDQTSYCIHLENIPMMEAVGPAVHQTTYDNQRSYSENLLVKDQTSFPEHLENQIEKDANNDQTNFAELLESLLEKDDDDVDQTSFAQDLENLLEEEEPIVIKKKPSLPQVVTRFEDLF